MYKKYNEQVNLNYLRVFDAIYIHRSTKLAASALGISQSAVSQTLAKLRNYTGDKLFYSANGQLQSTHRADAIGLGLNEQLDALDNRIFSEIFEDPSEFDGELTIAVSSVFLEAMATELTSSVVFNSFPKAKLNVTTWTDRTLTDIQNGDVHIGLNFGPIDTPKSIRSVELTSSEPIVIMRKGHPWCHGNFKLEHFNHYPTGGILVPGLTNFNAILERRHPEIFDFKYRSASMSVLTCLAEHSDILAITETLSASMCPSSIDCVQPAWLTDLAPEKTYHAIYYLERNHNHPLYRFCINIVRNSLQEKLDILKTKTEINI
ncbi:LysR family transcriptional regulator [Vibrio splendidus]|uniref:LysR family transcriptional regulator n=1 Tax=Vibrio splendidus TaxID=29497 RepID=A0A7Y4D4A1_VIBSP|nr:LysR family transcriptional regulator [Vibrio splendidus]NOJ12381.1 LysR family transcriptional regulator [Vibrio splendidus]